MNPRPGGELATRPLNFIWICDCSGSMNLDGKIQTLNTAIREAIPHMRTEADKNPNAQLLVRAIKFSVGATWHIATPTPVEDFNWVDLAAPEGGLTDMGRAFALAADAMKMPPMPERALPPVLVLVSDGQPTDDYKTGLKALFEQPWGHKAVRMAIAIGADADHNVLKRFINHSERQPLQANNPEALVNAIRWVSTVVVASVPAPPVNEPTGPFEAVPIPNVPTPPPPLVPPAVGPSPADPTGGDALAADFDDIW
jgi:uncharacterized protein YegL